MKMSLQQRFFQTFSVIAFLFFFGTLIFVVVKTSNRSSNVAKMDAVELQQMRSDANRKREQMHR